MRPNQQELWLVVFEKDRLHLQSLWTHIQRLRLGLHMKSQLVIKHWELRKSQTRSQSTEAQPKIIPSSAFSQAPSAGDPFLLREQNGAKPRTYRVVGIMEGDDGTVTVTGTQYNAEQV